MDLPSAQRRVRHVQSGPERPHTRTWPWCTARTHGPFLGLRAPWAANVQHYVSLIESLIQLVISLFLLHYYFRFTWILVSIPFTIIFTSPEFLVHYYFLCIGIFGSLLFSVHQNCSFFSVRYYIRFTRIFVHYFFQSTDNFGPAEIYFLKMVHILKYSFWEMVPIFKMVCILKCSFFEKY